MESTQIPKVVTMARFGSQGDGVRTLVWMRQTGSKTVLAFVAAAKTRKKWIAIASALIVLVVGVASLLLIKYRASQAAAAVDESYSSLSQCLIGEPLKEGERASMRFRKHQLMAMTQADVRRTPEHGEPWPERCAVFANKLHEGLKEAGQAEEGAKDLAHWSAELAKLLKEDGSFWKDISGAIDETWAQSGKLRLKAAVLPAVAGSAAQAEAGPPPLTVDSLAATPPVTKKPVALTNVHSPPHPDLRVHLLVEDKQLPQSPFWCTFEEEKEEASCQTLSDSIVAGGKTDFRMLGTADEDLGPLVFAGTDGSKGIYRADKADFIAEGVSLGGYLRGDGFAAILARDGQRLELIRKVGKDNARGGSLPPLRVKVEDPVRDVQLLWGHVLARGPDGDEVWLSAGEVSDRGAPVGNVTKIGKLGKVLPKPKKSKQPPRRTEENLKPRIQGCRDDKMIAAAVEEANATYLTIGQDGQWSEPAEIPGLGGVLTCHKKEATLTTLRISTSANRLETAIGHHRCTPSKCQHHKMTLKELLIGEHLLVPAALIAAAGLKGKLLVVWGAGERGGLRMRLAPAQSIANAPDVIVFDDLVKKGEVQSTSTLIDFRLLPAASFAILLLSTTDGIYAIRIKADGSYAPVKVAWG